MLGVGLGTTLSAQLPYQNPDLTPEQRATDLLQRLTVEEKISLMQNNSPGIPRLGIRPYEWWNEALHGVARAGLATVFPQTIGMAASFNDSLVQKVPKCTRTYTEQGGCPVPYPQIPKDFLTGL